MTILYRWLTLLVLLGAAGAMGWVKGAASVQSDWDAANSAAWAAADRIVVKQGAITERVVTQYRDRVKVIRETGQTIEKEVIKYVPLDSCDLPGGFRVLHDAAARGELPDPADGTDAGPVAAADVAGIIAVNYTQCRATAEQLIRLQEWADSVSKVTGEF